MKLRFEFCDVGEDEIIIRSSERDARISELERMLEGFIKPRRELVLYIGNAEYYVPISDILFFETVDGKVCAHTREAMYSAPHKLFELESILPSSFVRISKSGIVNVMAISSLSRELVGNGEVSFYKTAKKTYFSRTYYKLLKDRIEEIRFS